MVLVLLGVLAMSVSTMPFGSGRTRPRYRLPNMASMRRSALAKDARPW